MTTIRSRFLVGLAAGLVTGAAFLLAGALTLVPSLVIWGYLATRQAGVFGAAGILVGFGASWLLLIGQASWRCANDPSCTQIDPAPWFAFSIGLVVAGILLGLVARGRAGQAGSVD